MGAAHIVLGEAERRRYIEIVRENCVTFQEKLGLEYKGNFYYSTFDLEDLPGFNKKDVPAEENMLELAKMGVVYIPANLFFSKEDREKRDRKNYVRACLPNLTLENIIKAAEMTKEYVAG